MSRRILLTLLVFGAFGMSTVAYAQTCSTCSPTQKANWPTRQYTVSFTDGRISAADRAVIIDALKEWNSWFTSQGLDEPFVYSDVGPAEISIFVDDSMSGTTAGMLNTHAPTDGTGKVGVNPDYLNKASYFFKHSAMHELGHSLGYGHVTSSACNMRSIMFQSINPNGPFLSTITTADKCSLKSSFGTPTTTTGTGGTQQTTSGGDAITVWQDPLVLDLNGDGVRTSGASSPVRFDMQGDGQKELLTWTNPNTEEGFLWIDRNHDGVVTDGTELFGVGTDLPAGVKARDGFEALAMYDNPAYGGNGDGVISKDDDIWNRLRLWVDRNHDGYSSHDEHESIHAYHVEAIRLGYTYALADDESANVHRLHGTYLTKVVGDGPAHLENATVDSLLFRVLAP